MKYYQIINNKGFISQYLFEDLETAEKRAKELLNDSHWGNTDYIEIYSIDTRRKQILCEDTVTK